MKMREKHAALEKVWRATAATRQPHTAMTAATRVREPQHEAQRAPASSVREWRDDGKRETAFRSRPFLTQLRLTLTTSLPFVIVYTAPS